ncbi:opsin-VA-like [Pecten maximus]|uniref:opsin-VA-like n=1 Tax=Pecten maximus TaxID=6579 RepID=UPI001458465C|nr:opsin-VA-like [Pecten maximus]
MATHCYISSNSSDPIDYDTDIAPMWIRISVVVVGVATILVNIPAIIAVIFTKIRKPVVRNTHLLILGITDILAGVSLFPILLTFMDPNNQISHWSCFLRIFFFTFIYYNSIGQVCVICIDRFFLLSKPSWRYTSKYERRYFRMLSVMFLLTFVSVCLIFFILGYPKGHQITCKLDTLFCNNLHQFSAISGGVAVLIQCLIIICCIAMIVVLQQHRRKCRQIAPAIRTERLSEDTSNNQQEYRRKEHQYGRMNAESKSTLTMIIIIVNLFVCVTPLNLGFVMQGLHLVETTSRTTRHLFITLSSVNSLINPFIYCFRTPEVKATLNSGLAKFKALF